MVNKIIISLLCLLLLVAPALAENYQQGETIDFIHVVRVGGSPSSSLLANITITDPDGLLIVGFEEMTYNAINKTHNYTLLGADTDKIGTWERCITATDGTLNRTSCFNFDITPLGSSPTTSQGILYLASLAFSVLVFVLILYGAVRIPYRNIRSVDGLVVDTNSLKYVKIGLWLLLYIVFVWINFVLWNIFESFLYFDVASVVFKTSFFIFAAGMLPAVIVFSWVIIISAVKDSQIRKDLERGIFS